MMLTISEVTELRQQIQLLKSEQETIAFVPTMGNLHEGHLCLIDLAKSKADVVVCSIFVNPTQFGENEDFDSYPRTLHEDQEKLEARGCDIIFAPSVQEMYPGGFDKASLSQVIVPGISEMHCGANRPGHFTGVATVVSKLFNMVMPDIAIFGEKDFQQLAVIRKFSKELAFPVEIVGAPTTREESGLAMSSRNNYLDDDQKQTAALIYQTLLTARESVVDNEAALEGTQIEDIQNKAIEVLNKVGFETQYFVICDSSTLKPANNETEEFVILLAAILGSTRLIDNIYFSKTENL